MDMLEGRRCCIIVIQRVKTTSTNKQSLYIGLEKTHAGHIYPGNFIISKIKISNFHFDISVFFFIFD